MSAETPIETVERLSALARITIPEQQKEVLAAEFNGVLAYIAQLDELTLSKEETPAMPPLHNVFRDDAFPNERGSNTNALVGAFPAKEGNALSVKKIITHD
jgi:aspartyl/glutamyl-tRNA(Asn/Gln) amidotransferase C subunit